MFNAVTYANRLKEAGMAARVADVQAEEVGNMVNNTLATKDDLRMLKMELQGFIVKSLIAAIAAMGTLQGMMQMMK